MIASAAWGIVASRAAKDKVHWILVVIPTHNFDQTSVNERNSGELLLRKCNKIFCRLTDFNKEVVMEVLGRIGFIGLGIVLVGARTGIPVLAADAPIVEGQRS